MSVAVCTKSVTAIPVIDIGETFNGNPAAIARVASEINRACRETGFFYIAGHGISRSLVDAQFDWTKRFFDLSEKDKLALHMRNSPTGAGYEPIGAQTLGNQNSDSRDASPDLKESFYARLELSEDHPYARDKLRSFGYNQWPVGLPGFREQMTRYDSKMRELGGHLLSLIAVSSFACSVVRTIF